MQNDPPWLSVRLNCFLWVFCISGCQFTDSETSSHKGFRDYFFFCMLCFHVLARLSVARHFLPTLYCVFLLASRLVQGNQKISLPALSTSSIFYDPSICNLMVVEFPLPKQTLGKVPFIGLLGDPWTIILKQSSPCFVLQTTLILYYSV